MTRSFLFCLLSAGFNAALPATASACRLAPITESQRTANIEHRQAEAWERSAAVYLAEVVERTRSDGSAPAPDRDQLRLLPLIMLKGEASRPEALLVTDAGAHRRCGWDFLDIQEGANVGDRFVIYATTPQPTSEDDIWSQAWLEVRDPSAIRALAQHGWTQHGGWQDRER